MLSLTIQTRSHTQFLDITREIQAAISDLGFDSGTVTVYVPHTTAGVTINENADPDVVIDIAGALEKAVPWQSEYQHSEGNAAAHVKHFGHHDDFHNSNVRGVKQLIDFASRDNHKDIHHISTMSVGLAGLLGNAHYLFNEYDQFSKIDYPSHYIQTKLEAEKQVIEARQKGVNASIYRTGNLMFQLETGRFQRNIEDNAFYQTIKSFIKLGIVPDFRRKLIDMTFVDQASQAIAQLFNRSAIRNEIHHIVNPHAIGYQELGEFIQKCGYHIEIKQMDNLLDQICRTYNDEKFKYAINRLMLHCPLFSSPNLIGFMQQSEKTRTILNRIGFRWKPVNQDHFKKMITYCKNVRFL